MTPYAKFEKGTNGFHKISVYVDAIVGSDHRVKPRRGRACWFRDSGAAHYDYRNISAGQLDQLISDIEDAGYTRA